MKSILVSVWLAVGKSVVNVLTVRSWVRESLKTFWTLKRFFAWVESSMFCQVMFVLESLVAVEALVRTLIWKFVTTRLVNFINTICAAQHPFTLHLKLLRSFFEAYNFGVERKCIYKPFLIYFWLKSSFFHVKKPIFDIFVCFRLKPIEFDLFLI